jgi:hypothetical protein
MSRPTNSRADDDELQRVNRAAKKAATLSEKMPTDGIRSSAEQLARDVDTIVGQTWNFCRHVAQHHNLKPDDVLTAVLARIRG